MTAISLTYRSAEIGLKRSIERRTRQALMEGQRSGLTTSSVPYSISASTGQRELSSTRFFKVPDMTDDLRIRRSRAGEIAARRRWTDDERRSRAISRILSKIPGHKLTVAKLLEVLTQQESSLGPWNRENLRSAVQSSKKRFHNPRKAKGIRSYLKLEKGGGAVTFVKNSGRHPRGTGIVGECGKAFGKESLPRRIASVIGIDVAARAETFDVHSGTRAGKWSSPDFAVAFFRGRSRKPFALHCFEVQERVGNPKRVNIPQEIAQSFVCSKGYNRCWFMLHKHTWDSVDQRERDRAERLAGRLGVGIITYGDPRSGTTWRRVRKAAELDYVRSPKLMYQDLLKRGQG